MRRMNSAMTSKIAKRMMLRRLIQEDQPVSATQETQQQSFFEQAGTEVIRYTSRELVFN